MSIRLLAICALILCTAASADDPLVFLHQLPPITSRTNQAIEHYNKAHGLCETAYTTSNRTREMEHINRTEKPRLLRWIMNWLGPFFRAVEAITYDNCIAEYKLALKLDPKLPEAHFNIGWAYMHKAVSLAGIDDANKTNDLKSTVGHYQLYVKYAKKNTHSDKVRKLFGTRGKAS